jgi:hypothetical protein
MATETTAQRLCRYLAVQLSTMQNWGANYDFQLLTSTRLEIQFKDGEKVVVTFSTPGGKGK